MENRAGYEPALPGSTYIGLRVLVKASKPTKVTESPLALYVAVAIAVGLLWFRAFFVRGVGDIAIWLVVRKRR
jgi:hypothetical protein